MSTSDVAAYLARLGLDGRTLAPTYDTLVELHRRHLDAIPYENLSTMLGRPPSVTPLACLARVAGVGRAGYCFHQNAVLEAALRELGFEVSRRHGHVWTDPAEQGTGLNHLVLVVDGLPTDDHPAGRWWADVGLGDCFRDPLPVAVGTYRQGPFRYEITEVRDDGWSFRHDPDGSFGGLEVTSEPTDQTAVDAAHVGLTTPPDGAFTHLVVAQRRGPDRADTLRGCLLTRVDAGGRHETELSTYDAWRAALADEVGLALDDVSDVDLRHLYGDQWTRHQQWFAAGRP